MSLRIQFCHYTVSVKTLLYTVCIEKKVVELQHAIVRELLGVFWLLNDMFFMPSGEKISKYESESHIFTSVPN